VHESHYRDEVSDVETRRARVEAAVSCDDTTAERLLEALGVLVNEPSPC